MDGIWDGNNDYQCHFRTPITSSFTSHQLQQLEQHEHGKGDRRCVVVNKFPVSIHSIITITGYTHTDIPTGQQQQQQNLEQIKRLSGKYNKIVQWPINCIASAPRETIGTHIEFPGEWV